MTFSPASYATLKENVKDTFDDADAALRLMTEHLRSWPILKRNNYKQLADFTGFATNYVMQLMHSKNGAAFNPRNVINDLYGKFYPQMMGDYRREWAQEELLKGKRSDWDQVVWLLEWLKEKLKVAKAYYNADPNRQPIQLGMPSGIATEFKRKNLMAKGGSNSGAAKGATSEQKNRRLRWQMDYSQPWRSVLSTYSRPPVREAGEGASSVEDEALREDAELSQIVEEENRHKIMAPLPLDLLRQETMREQDRIPHRIPKVGRIPCQNKGEDVISCLAFFADNNSIQLEIARII